MKKTTTAIHTPFHRRDAYGALSMPVYNNVAYEFDDAATMSDAFCGRIDAPDYSRTENPTVTHLEDIVKALTGATAVCALNSGMAAVSHSMLAVCCAGKRIITSRHLFGNTYSFITETMARFGVKSTLVDFTDTKSVEQAMGDDACLVFLEILTNPQLEVADLREISRIAHAHNVPLIADTTVIPFTQFSAKSLGVDIEVVSSTKYISGGATSLGGLVIDYSADARYANDVKNELIFNLGAYMTPQVAYMQTLGLETLDARYRVQSQNALTLAQSLRALPQIKRVNYVGLPDNPYHDLSVRQFGPTAGAMLTIDLDSQEACYRFLNRLKVVCRATNLFDNRTLAIHPYSTIFGLFTPEQKASMDVLPTTIRLSVGLEDPDDLLADIEQALR